jgi:hypothetical protein
MTVSYIGTPLSLYLSQLMLRSGYEQWIQPERFAVESTVDQITHCFTEPRCLRSQSA